MATVSEWTATTITNAFQQLPSIPERIFMAGGGAKNSDLIARLERLLGRRFQPLDHLGITSDAREAVAFAVLADARLRGVAFDLSRVTGSQVPQGLGAIALP
jgi:anhydro-N-acetylmuramic acid kinase